MGQMASANWIFLQKGLVPNGQKHFKAFWIGLQAGKCKSNFGHPLSLMSASNALVYIIGDFMKRVLLAT